MWIRFWSGHTKNPAISKEDQFIWYRQDVSDEMLQDEARERMPQWVWDVDGPSYFGFDRLETLPDDIKQHLIDGFEAEVKYAQAMLDILRSP